MRIRALTSNIPGFRTIKFDPNVAVITGESIKASNARAHNLGKSTAIRIIKFVLLDGSKNFLGTLIESFPDANFCIDIEHEGVIQQYQRTLKKRKKGDVLNIEIGNIDYEYFIRFQDEFDTANPFRKPSFLGEDSTWKPRLIQLLGFDGELLAKKLRISKEAKLLEKAIETLRSAGLEKEKNETEANEIRVELKQLTASIESLRLLENDKNGIDKIINECDAILDDLRSKYYLLHKEISKIDFSISMAASLKFDFSDLESIYKEINLYFGPTLKKDMDELVKFNRAVYSNRMSVLKDMKSEKAAQLEQIKIDMEREDGKRSELIKSIISSETTEKYKQTYNRIVQLERRLVLLERDSATENIEELTEQLSRKQTEGLEAATEFSREIDNNRRKFKEISDIYSRVMREVMNISAQIEIDKKSTGNVDIVVRTYRNAKVTQELVGSTAKSISSAAVDIAMRAVQNPDKGFIIQDGILDDIDANAAGKFISTVRELAKTYNFQYIVTAIKERLPQEIKPQEIAIELNDYNDSGLLFGKRF